MSKGWIFSDGGCPRGTQAVVNLLSEGLDFEPKSATLAPFLVHIIEEILYLGRFIEAVVVYRVSIGNKGSGFFPVSKRLGGHSEYVSRFFYG